MNKDILKYLSVLAECLDEKYYDPDIVMEEMSTVTEATYRPNAAEGQVWYCDYPHLNFKKVTSNTHTKRWAIVMRNRYNELAVLMCSSIDASNMSKKEALKKPYNIPINDWQTQGFSKPSFIVGATLLPIRYVKLLKYKGDISNDTKVNCIKAINESEKYKFKEPFVLLNWLKNYIVGDTINPSGNNNLNPIQNIDDVITSRRINCVDTANIVHEVCARNNINHYIIWSKYFSTKSNSSAGHLYCIYRSGSAYRSFRFVSTNPNPRYAVMGDLIKYNSINEAISGESIELKKHFDKIFRCDTINENYKIYGKLLAIWDRYAIAKATQREMLNAIDAEISNNIMESFNSIEDILLEVYSEYL